MNFVYLCPLCGQQKVPYQHWESHQAPQATHIYHCYYCLGTNGDIINRGQSQNHLGQTKNTLNRIFESHICRRASRAKTRGWRGGSIIEPCESTVQAEKISSDRETCL